MENNCFLKLYFSCMCASVLDNEVNWVITKEFGKILL